MRRRLRPRKSRNFSAVLRQIFERNVDPVEISIVFGAILKMIDDLQRRAQGVGRFPRRSRLAVYVENKSPDGHRRIAAVLDEFGPGVVSAFGDILAKCLEKVECVLRGKISRSQFCAKRKRVARSVGSAEKRVFKS